ncbi:MAG: hypothetical protein ACUVWX_09555 [Kiritimatiellia bacterium]
MMRKQILWRALALAIGTVVVATGCAKRRGESGGTERDRPLDVVISVSVPIEGAKRVTGVKLLQANGRPLGYFFRAENGIVGCPHFDIDSLGLGGIPAATAKNWSEHSFEAQLAERILRVNMPARALGIEPGMTVGEALLRMSGKAGLMR